MAEALLQCAECGSLFESVEEAENHAELTFHANYSESHEPVVDLVCSSCHTPFNSKTAGELHMTTTGHRKFDEKPVEARKPIILQIRQCLLSLKQSCKGDEEKVKTALTALKTLVMNVVSDLNDEKFRKIRLANVNFQNKVGKLEAGIKFLELCKFEKIHGGAFLFLPPRRVDLELLITVGHELGRAIENPNYLIVLPPFTQ